MTKTVAQLHPTTIDYRDHIITLTHRPKTNDWQYSFKHTRTITISNTHPRYDTALAHARKEIDILIGDG